MTIPEACSGRFEVKTLREAKTRGRVIPLSDSRLYLRTEIEQGMRRALVWCNQECGMSLPKEPVIGMGVTDTEAYRNTRQKAEQFILENCPKLKAKQPAEVL